VNLPSDIMEEQVEMVHARASAGGK
jgi:hypothetical protein